MYLVEKIKGTYNPPTKSFKKKSKKSKKDKKDKKNKNAVQDQEMASPDAGQPQTDSQTVVKVKRMKESKWAPFFQKFSHRGVLPLYMSQISEVKVLREDIVRRQNDWIYLNRSPAKEW
jgi:hypothetical protein